MNNSIMNNNIIGRKAEQEYFDYRISQLKKGVGGMMLISGDAGMGKTFLLERFNEQIITYNELLDDKNSDSSAIYNVYLNANSPIGNIQIEGMQPLHLISLLIEKLMQDTSVSPEKKFAASVGMTLLACLPLLGEIPYAIKEIRKDLTQFKKEKDKNDNIGRSDAGEKYMKYTLEFAKKKPIVLFIDKLHWVDAETIDFIWDLFLEVEKYPIFIVAGYKNSEAISKALPILSLKNKLDDYKDNNLAKIINLNLFSKENISLMCKKNVFENYQQSEEFEEWIFNHSHGVPGVINEYLEYFAQNSLFDDTGKLQSDFANNEFLPSSIQQLFGEKLKHITEKEKNILAICSSEGIEFSAIVVSKLLNKDILTTIKKLRTIQNKTNFIKSIGPKTRYGVMTTVYRFTQAYYHSYFEQLLEYEESLALHSQITIYLKQQYDAASKEIREAIAPFLAAHSLKAGDNKTAEEMLIETAKTAKDYGSSEIINQTYENLIQELNNSSNFGDSKIGELLKDMAEDINIRNSGGEENEGSANVNEKIHLIDFESARKSIVNNHLANNHSLALAQINRILEDKNFLIDLYQKMQLWNLKATSYIELEEYSKTEELLNQALEISKKEKNIESECLTLNTMSILYQKINNTPKAIELLENAGNIVVHLNNNLQIITLSNIAIAMKSISPDKAMIYYNMAVKQCNTMGYLDLADDLKKEFNIE